MIIPVILEPTFEKVLEKIRIIEDVAPTIQIDIADNKLVSGKTFLDVEKLDRIETKAKLEIHFMVKNPAEFLKKNRKFIPYTTVKIKGVSTVFTQLVDPIQMHTFFKLAKKLGYKTGASINFDQDNKMIDPYVEEVDFAQFMSVVPGKQGNPFIPEVLTKIIDFKKQHPSITTQIDGGVDNTTLPQILKTGVDNITIGSAIFNSDNPKEKYLEFSKTAHGQSSNS
jgi:pentose-5-phosphate-3-epimerase